MIGEILNEKYRLENSLSESHVYEVYDALEIATGVTVVVKILKEYMAENPERVKTFSQEIQSFAGLSHPSIAEILDIDLYGDRPYVVTEKVEGEDLHFWIKNNPLPFIDCIHLIQELAGILQFAFDSGVEHRNIKLSNVLRTDKGKVTVLSFTHPRLKLAGKLSSTTKSGVQSDLFFLGSTLFELLTGESVIRRRGGVNELWEMKLAKQLRIKHANLEPAQIERVTDFVKRTLTREFSNRFEDHEEFLKALADLAGMERKNRIKERSKQMSMASQVVDAINGRMSNILPVVTSSSRKMESSTATLATSDRSDSKDSEIDTNIGTCETDGNLALKIVAENETLETTEDAKKPNLKLVKNPVQMNTGRASSEMWENESSHWLKNPVIFMGSCLIIMVFLIIFW
jgi:serine/threonine protein kinase